MLSEDKIVYSKENHIWYREGTTDLAIVRGQKVYEELFFEDVNTVLDVGAHIGAFACYAFQFVGGIICVEPEVDNFLLLLRNTADLYSTVIIRAAATDDEKFLGVGNAEFRVLKLPNRANHHFGKSALCVPVVSFRKLITVFEPDAVKIDIERGESRLDFRDLPSFIVSIAIEYHPASSGKKIHEILLEQDFLVVRLPDFSKKVNDVGIYRRVRNA